MKCLSDQVLAYNRRQLSLDDPDIASDELFREHQQSNHKLLVYGLMAPGGPHAHMLEHLSGEWHEVFFNGYLQSSAECRLDGVCPGLAWTPTGPVNKGHLFQSAALIKKWDVLDDHEGDDMIRLLAMAKMEDGQFTATNIYASRDATRTQLMMLDNLNVHADENV